MRRALTIIVATLALLGTQASACDGKYGYPNWDTGSKYCKEHPKAFGCGG